MLKLASFLYREKATRFINGFSSFLKRLPLIKKKTSATYRYPLLKKFSPFFAFLYLLLQLLLKQVLGHGLAFVLSQILVSFLSGFGVTLGVWEIFVALEIATVFFSDEVTEKAVLIEKYHQHYHLDYRQLALFHQVFPPILEGVLQLIIFISVTLFMHQDLLYSVALSLSLTLLGLNISVLRLYTKRRNNFWTFLQLFAVIAAFIFLQYYFHILETPVLAVTALVNVLFLFFSYRKACCFKGYEKLIKEQAKKVEVIVAEKNMAKVVELKEEDYGQEESLLSGYRMLTDLFFKRHRRLLWKPILLKVKFVVGVTVILLVVMFTPYGNYLRDLQGMERLLCASIPFVSYILYYNETLSKSFYYNCDNALLNYAFYRTRKSLFANFWHRYSAVVKMMLLPVATISLWIGEFYFFSLITVDTLWNALLLNAILAFFFSFFTLLCYYLMQPYTDDETIKNPLYFVITGAVYIICIQLPRVYDNFAKTILFFGVLTLVFVVMGLGGLYFFGEKTFVKKQ